MMRILLGILFLAPCLLMAQQPFINNISPTHIEVGQEITITGTNLGGRVFFGGVEATSVSGSGNSITATVPAGTTHGVITVLNNNLIAQSSKQFYISFSGTDITSFDAEYAVTDIELAAADLCMCDLDGDDKNDLIMVHNIGASNSAGSEFSVFRNNTSGTDAFAAPDFQLDQLVNDAFDGSDNDFGFISVTCADLDNDGRKDLIFAPDQGGAVKDVFIYRNQSTVGSIVLTGVSLTPKLPTSGSNNRIPRSIKVADMDGDGKNDLVVGNDTDNTFHIFRNTSSGPGNFAFSSAIEFQSGDHVSALIELADLNNDGALDVIAMPFSRSSAQGSSINIFQNQSISGNLSFADPFTITNITEISGVISADFDEDGLIDVVVGRRDAGILSVFRNTSATSISFGSTQNFSTGNSAFGVDVGDINGDGQVDLICAYANGDIHIFENTSTSGNIQLTNEQTLSTGSTTRNVKVGDLNGDAKPDIAYTRDVNVTSVGDLGIILNRNCIVPGITPSNLEFCLNDDFTVEATKSLGATYSWEIVSGGGTNPADTDSDAVFTITSGTTATIRVTVTQDGCSEQATADFTMLGGSQPTPPTFDAGVTDNICVGDNYDITVSGGPFAEYEWTLPDGSTTQTASGTLSLTNADNDDAGTYVVRAKPTTGCYSEQSSSFSLEVNQPPLFQIFNNGDDNFCSTSTVTLEVPDFSTEYDYQWRRSGSNVGTNSPTFTASQTGDYSVILTDKVDNCTIETNVYTVNAISEPESAINGPTETCEGFETTFTATSTGQSGFTLEYSWTVDGSPVSPTDPTTLLTTFTGTGSHTVTLTTSYNSSEVASCSDQTTFNVTVSAEPVITFDQTDLTPKCQGDLVTVNLTSPAAATIASTDWTIRNYADNTLISTSSGSSLDVSTAVGIDTVWAVADITTTIGCNVKDSIRIRNFESTIDISSTDFASILTFDSALLEDATSLQLTAENLVSNIAWEPADQFDDATATTVTYFPQNPTSTVTLSGVDSDGCPVSTTVEIYLDNIRPKRTFSPNGDGLNDCWEILNIGDLGVSNGCKVYVFDSRGRNIIVKDTFDDGNCVWNGTSGGSQVPEGVYYFVMKCNSEELSKSGSILLAR